MSFLLDTNVVSELRKSKNKANRAVRRWASQRSPSELYLSVVTVLEVELGITRLDRRDAAQADRLQRWFEEDLLAVFDGRILPVDVPTARQAARLYVPDPRPKRDALIAATALTRGLTVVTRNVADFAPMNVAVNNPWDDLGQ